MQDANSRGQRLTRRELLRWISMAGAAGLAACGGGSTDESAGNGGGGGNPPGGGGGGVQPADPVPGTSSAGKGVAGAPVTPAQRLAALSALETKLDELFDATTGRASAGQMLAWLAEQDAFQTIGYSATRDVYAIFTDGRPILIATNLRIGTDGVSDGPPLVATGERETHAARPTERAAALTSFEAGVPSKQFRFLNTWYTEGVTWPTDTWCIPNSSMDYVDSISFNMPRFGYELVGGDEALKASGLMVDVELLKNVKNDGVFFWATHGGMLDPAGGNIIQGLMTSTDATQAAVEVDYADEFTDGTLIYYTGPLCPGGLCAVREMRPQTRLAITPKWIKKYRWAFGEHSMVFVNACASANGAMKQAFLDAGASVYLGWNNPVRAWAMCGAALDFFSLMLGLNENRGGIYPKQRPYDWGQVLFHLQAHTQAAYYLDVEDGIVQLEATLNTAVPAGFLCLRPSIYWNAFDEALSELHLIGGVFGTHPGTAAIGTDMPCDLNCLGYGNQSDFKLTGAVPLTVKAWQSQDVVLQVPREGPGSVGIVQVDVDGRYSNGTQLTRISLPLKATQAHGGSLSVQVDGQLSIRGDFRGVRLDPIQDLTYMPVVPCLSPASVRGIFTANGTYTYSEGDSTVQVKWSGSGNVVPPALPAGSTFLYGEISPKERSGLFLISLSGTGIVETVTVTTPGLPDSVSTREITFTIETQPGQTKPYTLAVQFTPAYTAGAVTHSYVQPAASRYNQADLATTIMCGPFTSEFPPEETRGGR